MNIKFCPALYSQRHIEMDFICCLIILSLVFQAWEVGASLLLVGGGGGSHWKFRKFCHSLSEFVCLISNACKIFSLQLLISIDETAVCFNWRDC
jgi:hypothetical protein